MKTIILSAALALTAAPALASDQLALSLGVEPGVFSTAQLVQLQRAYESDDQARIDYILSGAAPVISAPASAAGLDAAISLHEEEGDYRQAEALRDRRVTTSGPVASSRSAAGLPGHLQAVAAEFGIDTASVSTGDLVNLARAVEEGDQRLVRGIVSRIQG